MEDTALCIWDTDALPALVSTVSTSCVRSAWLAFSSTPLLKAATSLWLALPLINPVRVVPNVASLLIAKAISFSVSSAVTAPPPTIAPIAESTSARFANALTLIPAISTDCAVDSDAIAWCCPLTVLDSRVDTDAASLCRTDAAVEMPAESPASTV